MGSIPTTSTNREKAARWAAFAFLGAAPPGARRTPWRQRRPTGGPAVDLSSVTTLETGSTIASIEKPLISRSPQ